MKAKAPSSHSKTPRIVSSTLSDSSLASRSEEIFPFSTRIPPSSFPPTSCSAIAWQSPASSITPRYKRNCPRSFDGSSDEHATIRPPWKKRFVVALS